MKYSFNINQKALAECGLIEKIDSTDPYIFDYIIAFSQSEGIQKTYFEGATYYWFNYKHILNQIPIIKIKTPDAIYRRFKKYEQLDLLKAHPDNQSLGRPYYKILPLLENVTCRFGAEKEKAKNRGVVSKTEGSVNKPVGSGAKTVEGPVPKPNDNTIRDNTINNKKEKYKKEKVAEPHEKKTFLINQVRAKALSIKTKQGFNLIEWLDYRFPSSKAFNKKWFNEWLEYFVDESIKRDLNPLELKEAFYCENLEKITLSKAQELARKRMITSY
jgi:hypothetical protein